MSTKVWSARGCRDAPTEVLQMLVTAAEVGYLVALNDLPHGASGQRDLRVGGRRRRNGLAWRL